MLPNVLQSVLAPHSTTGWSRVIPLEPTVFSSRKLILRASRRIWLLGRTSSPEVASPHAFPIAGLLPWLNLMLSIKLETPHSQFPLIQPWLLHSPTPPTPWASFTLLTVPILRQPLKRTLVASRAWLISMLSLIHFSSITQPVAQLWTPSLTSLLWSSITPKLTQESPISKLVLQSAFSDQLVPTLWPDRHTTLSWLKLTRPFPPLLLIMLMFSLTSTPTSRIMLLGTWHGKPISYGPLLPTLTRLPELMLPITSTVLSLRLTQTTIHACKFNTLPLS